MMASLSKTIVDRIIEDLTDRRGLRHEWDECDDEIQEEIRQEWETIVEDTLSDWSEE
jgi:trans-2-enoyl-CoA reductase